MSIYLYIYGHHNIVISSYSKIVFIYTIYSIKFIVGLLLFPPHELDLDGFASDGNNVVRTRVIVFDEAITDPLPSTSSSKYSLQTPRGSEHRKLITLSAVFVLLRSVSNLLLTDRVLQPKTRSRSR